MIDMTEKTRIEKIQEFLLEHPEGLTIQDLAKLCNVTTITMSNELNILVERKQIYRRIVGNAKLHYHLKHVKKFRE